MRVELEFGISAALSDRIFKIEGREVDSMWAEPLANFDDRPLVICFRE